jgi:hypothetical protein
MPRVHAEALLFCAAWASVALAGGLLGGPFVGLAVAFGLLLVLMPLSAYVLTEKEDERLERQLRWGVLVLAALALGVWLTA